MEFTKLKEYMDYLTTKVKVPGVDCIVYKDHKELFRYYTGKRDKEENKPMDGNEIYLIFSMTKMLTCTAALQLKEKGKFTLDDPVSKFMPEFAKMRVSGEDFDTENAAKIVSGASFGEDAHASVDGYAKNPITVKHLFTMGAGFDYNLDADYFKKAIKEGRTTTREMAGELSNCVLGFEPGTRYRYSLCHDILGALIEIWSGQRLSEYMKENVFEPIGMKNTFFGVDQNRLGDYAARYKFDEKGNPERLPLECMYNLSPQYESGGAGLTSCTEDYALFLDALASGGVAKNGNRILKEDTVKLMGTNHLNTKQCDDFDNMRPGYGYGLGVRTHINPERSGALSPVGEFGWDGAAGAFSMVDTKNKLSLTYFQHVHNWPLKIQTEMRNALYEELVTNMSF